MEIKESNCYTKVNSKKSTMHSVGNDINYNGSWRMYRNDAANTGIQFLGGKISEPVHERLIFTGGSINTSSMFYDANDDGDNELFLIDSGRVIMAAFNGETVWSSAFISAGRIFDITELTDDGRKHLIIFADNRLIILDPANGSILCELEFGFELVDTQTVINDFDKDGKKELFVNVYGDPNIYVYKFENYEGRLIVKLMNTIDGKPHMMESFRPAFAFSDIDKDGYDEFLVIRYLGISIYDARALSSGKLDEIIPLSKVEYIPNGADNGRFYGLFCLKDVNGDGMLDGIMLADGVSMHAGVLENSQDHFLIKKWDKYFGYAGITNSQGNNVLMRVIGDPVPDVTGAGEFRLVFGLFEYRDDAVRGNWKLCMISTKGYEHSDSIVMQGFYLWGVAQAGNKNPLFFLSKEDHSRPAMPDRYEIYMFDEQKRFIKVMELDHQLLYKDTRMPNNFSPANYNGGIDLYTVDTDNDGFYEMLTYKNGKHHIIKIMSEGRYEIKGSFGDADDIVFNDFMDSEKRTYFLVYNKKGIIKLLDMYGNMIWKRCCGGFGRGSILIGDVTGKGRNSVIMETNGSIEVIDIVSKGVSVRRHTFTGEAPILVDIDKDGMFEIACKTLSGNIPSVKVKKADGNEIISYPFTKDLNGEKMEFSRIKELTAADVTGDGIPDIIAGLQNSYTLGRTVIIDGASKELIYSSPPCVKACFVHSNKMIIDRAVLAQRGMYATADIDGDGFNEIYFVSMETFMRIKRNDNGFEVDTYIAQINPDHCRIYYSTPYVFDMDQDGISDIFFGSGFNSISVYDGRIDMQKLTDAASPKWDYILENNRDILDRDQGILVLDTDKGTRTVIALQHSAGSNRNKGILKAFCGTDGRVLWEYDMKEKFGGKNVSVRNILSCDIDNDGKMEFIVATNTGFVGALKAEETLGADVDRLLWICDVGAPVGTIALGDADNDGYSEIIFRSDDGWINVIRNRS